MVRENYYLQGFILAQQVDPSRSMLLSTKITLAKHLLYYSTKCWLHIHPSLLFLLKLLQSQLSPAHVRTAILR